MNLDFPYTIWKHPDGTWRIIHRHGTGFGVTPYVDQEAAVVAAEQLNQEWRKQNEPTRNETPSSSG